MFKDSFKYYKSKKDPPDLGTVIDFDRPATIGQPGTAVRRPLADAGSVGDAVSTDAGGQCPKTLNGESL